MKKLILLTLLALIGQANAGYDHSFEASIDGWVITVDTAGLGRGEDQRVATRVFLSHPNLKVDAKMELDSGALYVAWEHLSKLPRVKKSKAGENYVRLDSNKEEYIDAAKAIPLICLWLDTQKSSWRSNDKSLLDALKERPFPESVAAHIKKAQSGPRE